MKSSLCLLLVCAAAGIAHAAAPPEELKFAVIVSRHGVRSPTWTSERLNQYSTSPWPDWGVAPGELTPHGRALMQLMGAYYRETFTAKGLLKAGCANRVFFRADNAQRTLGTAEALAQGMLPGCKTEIHSAGKDEQDTLFDGTESGTARLDPAMSLAAVLGRLGPKPEAITDVYKPALDLLAGTLNGGGKAKRSIFQEPFALNAGDGAAAMTGPLNVASTLTEDFLLEYADGMSGERFGWGRLTPAQLLELMSLHTTYADLMRRTPYIARTRGSNLLNYVLRSIEEAASGKSANSLLVISGHDTNLSNLSGMMDLNWLLPGHQPNDTPPGGALIFELWKVSGKYVVKVQYAAQTPQQMHDATPGPPAVASVFMPACSTAAEGYPCSLESFTAAARAAILPGFVAK